MNPSFEASDADTNPADLTQEEIIEIRRISEVPFDSTTYLNTVSFCIILNIGFASAKQTLFYGCVTSYLSLSSVIDKIDLCD